MKTFAVAHTYYHLLMLFAHERQGGPIDRIAFVGDVEVPPQVLAKMRRTVPNLVFVEGRWGQGGFAKRLRTRAISRALLRLKPAGVGRILVGTDIPPEMHALLRAARAGGCSVGLVEDGIGVYLGGPDRLKRPGKLRLLAGKLAYGRGYQGAHLVGASPSVGHLLVTHPELIRWKDALPLSVGPNDASRLAALFEGELGALDLEGCNLLLGPNPDNPRYEELFARMLGIARGMSAASYMKRHPRDARSAPEGFMELPAFLPVEALAGLGRRLGSLVTTVSTPAYSLPLLAGKMRVHVVGAGKSERPLIQALNPEVVFHD
jgi:hypothetical protein